LSEIVLEKVSKAFGRVKAVDDVTAASDHQPLRLALRD